MIVSSRVPELFTTLHTPDKRRRRYVYDSVASTRSRFQGLSLGVGVGDEGVAVRGDEVEPGRPTWRVHAFEQLLPIPLTAAEQGANIKRSMKRCLLNLSVRHPKCRHWRGISYSGRYCT
jgi:hypothetical protein